MFRQLIKKLGSVPASLGSVGPAPTIGRFIYGHDAERERYGKLIHRKGTVPKIISNKLKASSRAGTVPSQYPIKIGTMSNFSCYDIFIVVEKVARYAPNK